MSGLQVPDSHWRRCSIGWRWFTWLGYRFPIVTVGAAQGATEGSAEGISGYKSLYGLSSNSGIRVSGYWSAMVLGYCDNKC